MKLIPPFEIWERVAEPFWSDRSQFSCFNVPHSHTIQALGCVFSRDVLPRSKMNKIPTGLYNTPGHARAVAWELFDDLRGNAWWTWLCLEQWTGLIKKHTAVIIYGWLIFELWSFPWKVFWIVKWGTVKLKAYSTTFGQTLPHGTDDSWTCTWWLYDRYKYTFQLHLHQNTIHFRCSEPEMANVFWLCSTVGEDSHCSLMPSLSLPQLGADQGRIVPGGLWEIQRFLDEQIIHFRWLNCFCHCFGIYLCTWTMAFV